jgi:small subunit ribosomal protein S8
MYTDTIADLLTRIRNAQKARHTVTTVPYSRFKHEICELLVSKNFLKGVSKIENEGEFPQLSVELVEERRIPLTFTRVSKSGQRIYAKAKDFKNIKNGLGIQVVSTSKGLMTGMEAKKQNLGGEIVCEVY